MFNANHLYELPLYVRLISNHLTFYSPDIQQCFILHESEPPALVQAVSNLQLIPVKSLNELNQILETEMLKLYRAKGYLCHNKRKEYERIINDEDNSNAIWMKIQIQFQARKGVGEFILPKFLISSAILTQLLAIFTAAISIYVKGLSIPVTVLFSGASAMSTLINFMFSGTPDLAASAGRYLDNKPLIRFKEQFILEESKALKFIVGSLIFAVWGLTLSANTISTFSETEIIDKAGYDAGWEFLDEKFIFWHALAYTILGGITVGSFSATFALNAYTQLSKFLGEWLSCQPNYENSHELSHSVRLEQTPESNTDLASTNELTLLVNRPQQTL